MISDIERQIIEECARKYAVEKVILFGSAAERDDARDIDLGVDGVPASAFFRFIGELIKRLPRPVDVIDLSAPTLFARLVREEGIPIYG